LKETQIVYRKTKIQYSLCTNTPDMVFCLSGQTNEHDQSEKCLLIFSPVIVFCERSLFFLYAPVPFALVFVSFFIPSTSISIPSSSTSASISSVSASISSSIPVPVSTSITSLGSFLINFVLQISKTTATGVWASSVSSIKFRSQFPADRLQMHEVAESRPCTFSGFILSATGFPKVCNWRQFRINWSSSEPSIV